VAHGKDQESGLFCHFPSVITIANRAWDHERSPEIVYLMIKIGKVEKSE